MACFLEERVMTETWSHLCRCCLDPNAVISLLDDLNEVNKQFFEITTLQVTKEDELPHSLCNTCYNELKSAFEFKEKCVAMDKDLRKQLNILRTVKTEPINIKDVEMEIVEKNDLNNMNMKTEMIETDDDYYYVLVIDEAKNGQIEEKLEEKVVEDPVKEMEIELPKEIINHSIESYIIPERIPDNVPSTILENEESQEDDLVFQDNAPVPVASIMPNPLVEHKAEEKQQVLELVEQNVDDVTSLISKFPNAQNSIIKILTSANQDTIFVSDDNVAYLTDAEFDNDDCDDFDDDDDDDDDDDEMSQEEVIVYEGDESQFQVLKCEGSELVIEYTDKGEIATVMQQEDGRFLCECGKTFESLDDYEVHLQTHVSYDENLCNYCGKGFEGPEILTGHLLLHNSSDLLLSCPYCDRIIRRNILTQHIKYSHSRLKVQCKLCSKTFSSPNNLRRHMKIHLNIRNFECEICHKRFHQNITLKTHRLTHINPFACVMCDEVFASKADITKHKESNLCTKSKLAKIKEELFKNVKTIITSENGELLGFSCTLCKEIFSMESSLETHVQETHMVDPMELLCSECGEIMPTIREMQSHMMTHKSLKMKYQKRFQCQICNKGCASQAMLLMHERVHTNERPYGCQLCTLRFKTKTHLRTHQLTHTREKKFGCSVCMKFFALKGNLVVHLRTHTGERPYVCSICNEGFIDSKYLKKHKVKAHSIDHQVPWNEY